MYLKNGFMSFQSYLCNKEHKMLMDDLDKLAQVKICQVAHSNEA